MSNDLIPEDVQEKYIVPGLERGLRLLCEFSHKDRVLSAPELARRLKVPRSTVFRLLTTLEVMGFIERVDGGRDFRLGIEAHRCVWMREVAYDPQPLELLALHGQKVLGIGAALRTEGDHRAGVGEVGL